MCEMRLYVRNATSEMHRKHRLQPPRSRFAVLCEPGVNHVRAEGAGLDI